MPTKCSYSKTHKSLYKRHFNEDLTLHKLLSVWPGLLLNPGKCFKAASCVLSLSSVPCWEQDFQRSADSVKMHFSPFVVSGILTFTFYIWIPKVGTSFTIVNINDVTWSNSKSNTFWILIEKVLNIIKSLVKDSFSQLHLARNKTTTNY